MPMFFANCSHLLIRTQEKKFKDVFLFKVVDSCQGFCKVPL